MHDWRKTTDENLNIKDAKITELLNKAQKADKELAKYKAENSMLRKNQKEWLGSTTKQMEEQRNYLQIKLNKIEEERSREVETLTKERTALTKEKESLLEKIEELDAALSEKKGDGLLALYLEPEGGEEAGAQSERKGGGSELDELNSKNKKLKKKLLQKDDKVK